MNPNILFSGINNLISGLILIGIIVILFYESINDVKYRQITKHSVILLYILTPIYIYINNKNMTETSIVFLFTLTIFLIIYLVSMKQFGMGDVLVIGSIGWILGNFNSLQNFLFIMGLLSIPWATYWMVHYFKKNGYWDIIKKIKTRLPIDKIKPGMVLAEDGFMHGLTEKDIQNMKNKGETELTIKQPLPFIPIVFLSFILTLI